MDLPKNEKTFDFKHEGEIDSYQGRFTVKCVLSLADRYARELEISKMKVGLSATTDELTAISEMISNLKVRIIDGPDWWKKTNGLEIMDISCIMALYDKVLEQEVEWRKELKAKKEELKGN